MPVEFKSSGSFNNTESFLRRMSKSDIFASLDVYARKGVAALKAATPVETGLTADLWGYEVTKSGHDYKITWTNSHVVHGVSIALIIQYGHGTGTGGYVQGRDYINPAIQPVFDQILNDVWKAVTSA